MNPKTLKVILITAVNIAKILAYGMSQEKEAIGLAVDSAKQDINFYL